MRDIPRRLVVHPGGFHCDDVLVAAMMLEINPDIEIQRLAGPAMEEAMADPSALVADIGGGPFDHHQPDAARRPDGRKHAACGLVHEEFSELLRPRNPEAAAAFDIWLEAIEDADNGEIPKHDDWCPLTQIVGGSNPAWDDDSPTDEAFAETVELVRANFVEPLLSTPEHPGTSHPMSVEDVSAWMAETLDEVHERQQAATERASAIVDDAIARSHDGVLELDRWCPWMDAVYAYNKEHPDTMIEHVTFPSNRGTYNVQAVRKVADSYDMHAPLPEEWLETPPEGCSFVHTARFLAAFDTQENAVAAAYSLHGLQAAAHVTNPLVEAQATLANNMAAFATETPESERKAPEDVAEKGVPQPEQTQRSLR